MLLKARALQWMLQASVLQVGKRLVITKLWLPFLYASIKIGCWKQCVHQCRTQWRIQDFWKGGSSFKGVGVCFADLLSFLAHLSRRLRGELLVYQWLRRPLSIRRPSVVRQHFQTSSPLKPLGQLNSNFIWRLLRMGERKFVQMVLVTWPRWRPCPYMVKNT